MAQKRDVQISKFVNSTQREFTDAGETPHCRAGKNLGFFGIF